MKKYPSKLKMGDSESGSVINYILIKDIVGMVGWREANDIKYEQVTCCSSRLLKNNVHLKIGTLNEASGLFGFYPELYYVKPINVE